MSRPTTSGNDLFAAELRNPVTERQLPRAAKTRRKRSHRTEAARAKVVKQVREATHDIYRRQCDALRLRLETLSWDCDNSRVQVRRLSEERDNASGDADHWRARLAEHRRDTDRQLRALEDHNVRLLNNARTEHEAVVANLQDQIQALKAQSERRRVRAEECIATAKGAQGRYRKQIGDLKAEVHRLRASLSPGWPFAAPSQEAEKK